ncbi:MAG: molybdopterin-dependent oxidoreductase [Betaproteobacteria bacterium]|nr:molybdopterin-dependent oxidoreductase [Betaproteobacteria bacterium]
MNPEKLQKTTCPRDCYDRCGILAVVRDGRVAEIRGDPDSPVSRGMLCAKCTIAYNGVWLDPAQRVTQPLRRTGTKGEARFAEISWDEALDQVANRLQSIARDHGADKVLHAHYQGTYSAIACNFPCRFFHRYGATEVDPGTICDKAGHVALQGMLGTSFEGFDARSRDGASCLVLWGVNPSHGGPLTDRFWVGEFPGTRIVIDPVRTFTATQADIHLRPRPGTDAALAYGLLRLLSDAGRFDRTSSGIMCRVGTRWPRRSRGQN